MTNYYALSHPEFGDVGQNPKPIQIETM